MVFKRKRTTVTYVKTKRVKKAPIRRRRYGSKSKRMRRAAVCKDPTVTKSVVRRAQVVKVVKGYPIIGPNTAVVAGTNGLQCPPGTNANAVTTVDPSGSWGTFSGLTNSASMVPAKIPQWDAYKGLYQKYKVTKVTLKWTAYDGTSTLDDASPHLAVRYNDDYTATLPTWTDVATERNWIRKTFTAEHPTFQYSFYPKVMAMADNVNVLATDSRIPKKMPWTDVDTPVELFGFKYLINNNQGNSTRVNCDIFYTILFKEDE